MGLLPNRVADSDDNALQCSPAAAECVPGAVVEAFRLLPGSDARGSAHRCVVWIAGSLEAGAAGGRLGRSRVLDSYAYCALSGVVCAEHAGSGGYLCRCVFSLGAGLQHAGRGSATCTCDAVLYGGCALEGDGDCHPGHAGDDFRSGGISLRAARASTPVEGGGVAHGMCAAAAGVVRLALRENWIRFWKSRISQIQRGSKSFSTTLFRGFRSSHSAPDSTHEHVRACSVDDRGADAESSTRPGWP